MLLMLVGSLVFVAAGLLFPTQYRALNLSMVIVFGLCAVVFCINLLPNSSYLSLTSEGFTICSTFRCRSIEWRHVSNFGVATRFEYVSAIVSLFRLKTLVKPVDSSRFPRAASVPANESMASVKLSEIGIGELRPWREALSSYIAQFHDGAA